MPPREDASGPPLFLAFADGAFHYVCAECTAICCRGQGFGGSLRREMQTLLTLYPSLGSAAVARHGSVLTFQSAPPQCYFLDPDNLCRIEKQHGRGLKPGVCTLFPFNVFTRIGDTVAVSPHFLCPLRLNVPPRPGEVEGTHAAVEAAVRESGLLDEAYMELQPKASLFGSQDASTVLVRERAFRDLCSASLGKRRFAGALREDSADPAALDAFVGRASAILGLEPTREPRERDRTDDLLLALASPLRLSLLSLSSEGILRALALGEIVARQVLSLSPEEPTPQAVHKVVSSAAAALKLLALGDEPVVFPEGEVKVRSLGSPELTFAAYLALREARGPAGTLAALEKAIKPGMSLADRSVLLNYLGNEATRSQAAPARRRRKSKAEGALSGDKA